ncbi:MAG: cytochrome c [Pseudomonadota bacterium]|nr:cytochrome c [Pseudomonadota bacterium]
MKTHLAIAGLAMTAFTLSTAWAGDPAKGKQLHDAHCTACHVGMTGGDGSILYTRKDRRMTNIQELQKQVRRCETAQGLKLFDNDIDDLVTYLNSAYYKFPSP